MDFINKNKILTVMAAIAILSFVLEKTGIIHPWKLFKYKFLDNKIELNEINKPQELLQQLVLEIML